MFRTLFLSVPSLLASSLLIAASGGPDTYGYTWKDSNEPGGPVYNWIDITTTGVLVTGLADDNVVGPYVMTTNMPFYWYDTKKVWIGSNGYLAFNGVNIASPFPLIPTAGGANDYIAGLMADLTFMGAGNTAQCYLKDDVSSTIVSYINVPFWTAAAPGYTGSNTFQFILNKADSTITVQFQQQTGLTQNNDIGIGIESITGDIGLQHSADTYPPVNYAIRYYNPSVPLLTVIDASLEWNSFEGNQGVTLATNASPFTMTVNVRNTGNAIVSNFDVTGSVRNTGGTVLATDVQSVGSIIPANDTVITYATTWQPTTPGTYRMEGQISGIANELIASNNLRIQELSVYDPTAPVLNIDWAGTTDDGVGLGWDGGDGGVGTYISFPSYPAYISGTTVRISSNTGPSGFTMKVFDDDGPNGTPGTLLDSVFVAGAQAGPGDHVYPLSSPITLLSGGVYVQWYMQGPNVNIARDIVPPFSLNSYEVLANVWAEYRDRSIADFHLGVQVTVPPVLDAGCSAFFGLIDGLNVGGPTVVRTWVRNYGNQPINGFPVSYQFASDPVVTQNFGGPPIGPGDSSLFNFSQQFIPIVNGPATLCAWASYPGDSDALNDTNCVSININVGIREADRDVLSVHPVPANDVLMIRGVAERGLIRILDATGREVERTTVIPSGGLVMVDVNDLPTGQYHVLLITQEHFHSARFVVAR